MASYHGFVLAIMHGDEEHRAWLIDAAAQYQLNGTVPPVRGGSKKTALLKECLNVLEDCEEEMAQDEVCELISMALDRKVERVLEKLREYLDE